MPRILQGIHETNGATTREAIETTGEAFSRGAMLELIRIRAACDGLKLPRASCYQERDAAGFSLRSSLARLGSTCYP